MKADLHIHSTRSDGKATPREIVERAIELGLGCIAIMDHNTIQGYLDVKDEDRIIIVPGIEITSDAGHILAYGVTEDIPSMMSVKDTVDAIHAAGGYAFVAHPHRIWSGLKEKDIIDGFDGIEGLNRRSSPAANRKAMKIAERKGLPVSAGSDAHSLSSIGLGLVELPDTCGTWRDVMEAVLSKNVEIWCQHRTLKMTVKYGVNSIGKWIFRGFKRT
ncbi:MAG: CehA/McbA family metallohydrolase [Thermoplasmatales archaeon]|nr:CehA/McbA family metallohydrolase [Thermoplasmatales archaeon]